MSTLEFNTRLISLMQKLEFFAIQLTANQDDAKDLIQETMFKALKNRAKFQSNGNFKAWVYTIMKNTFINNYRRSKRMQPVMQQSEDGSRVQLDTMDHRPYPDSDYQYNEIQLIINQLEDHYRIPFTKFTNGFKYEEIASELDLPIGTVKSRIFLARKWLMEKLKGY